MYLSVHRSTVYNSQDIEASKFLDLCFHNITKTSDISNSFRVGHYWIQILINQSRWLLEIFLNCSAKIIWPKISGNISISKIHLIIAFSFTKINTFWNELHLLLRRKVMTNSILKKRERCYFASKDLYSQSYGFSSSHGQMSELDHKDDWLQKNWCFWTVVLRRLLRAPWTARRSNQSILKEINSEYSLEELLLKLKLSTWVT